MVNKNQHENWTEEEDNYLKENFNLSAEELIQNNLPNRTVNSIYQRKSKLGIKSFIQCLRLLRICMYRLKMIIHPKKNLVFMAKDTLH